MGALLLYCKYKTCFVLNIYKTNISYVKFRPFFSKKKKTIRMNQKCFSFIWIPSILPLQKKILHSYLNHPTPLHKIFSKILRYVYVLLDISVQTWNKILSKSFWTQFIHFWFCQRVYNNVHNNDNKYNAQ